jgi:hypothetical protein
VDDFWDFLQGHCLPLTGSRAEYPLRGDIFSAITTLALFMPSRTVANSTFGVPPRPGIFHDHLRLGLGRTRVQVLAPTQQAIDAQKSKAGCS